MWIVSGLFAVAGMGAPALGIGAGILVGELKNLEGIAGVGSFAFNTIGAIMS